MIHAAMKIDVEDARRLGLNPEKLIVGAFVGVAILSDVRPYSREDARLLQKKKGRIWVVSPQFLVGLEKTAPNFADQSQGAT